mgnify:CR=1 FL=1
MSANARPIHGPEQSSPPGAPVPTHDSAAKLADDFQQAVGEYLIRHRSVLDVLSKMQEASARVQRAVAKAVTVCGCIRIEASRQALSDVTSEDVSYADLKQFVQSHVAGQLCHNCRDVIEVELGQAYFYTTALAQTFNMRAADVLAKEKQRLETLGVFNLT